jgi:hypothetical protein
MSYNQPHAFNRIATRFNRLLVRLRTTERDTVDFGDYQGSPLMVIQLPPGQTADALQVQDSTGNVSGLGKVLYSVDKNGNFTQGGITAAKQLVNQTTLSAAQITTLHSVPVSIVAAPGAGIAVMLDALLFQFKYGTVQFTNGGAVSPVYHGASTNHLGGSIAQATIQAAANATISAGALAAAFALSTNTGIDLLAAGADFAGGGDSTAIVTAWYTQYTLG